MIYDDETKRWFLNEFHLEHYRACMRSNERIMARLPLTHEEVKANLERWYARDEK